MFLVLFRRWNLVDFSDLRKMNVIVSQGVHAVERIAHPENPEKCCLVLNGTSIGAEEQFLRSFISHTDDTKIEIIE